MSFMPQFLDFESIDYLFKLALKHNSLEALIKKKLDLKIKLKKKEIKKKKKEKKIKKKIIRINQKKKEKLNLQKKY